MDNIGNQYVIRVMNERDPILREIWAQGYTHIKNDQLDMNLLLINKQKEYIKKVNLNEFHGVVSGLSFKRGLMPDGTIHTWVAEADGSAGRLRALIEPKVTAKI